MATGDGARAGIVTSVSTVASMSKPLARTSRTWRSMASTTSARPSASDAGNLRLASQNDSVSDETEFRILFPRLIREDRGEASEFADL